MDTRSRPEEAKEDLHPVLLRQLKKLGVSTSTVPTIDEWLDVLARIDHAYEEADRSRYLSERSSELVSEEMRWLHDRVVAEKEHLESVTNAITDGVLGIDSRLIVVIANPAALRLLGREASETIGRAVEEVLGGIEYSGASVDSVGAIVCRHLVAGESWRFDRGVVMTDADARHVALTLTAGSEDQDETVATLVLRDVTADVIADQERRYRQHLEVEVADRDDQLAQAERRAVGLIENVSDILMLVNADMTFSWASPSLERELGWADSDLASMPLHELLHPDDLPELSAQFEAFVDEPGATLSFDARISDSTNRYRWLEVIVANHVGDPVLDGYVIRGRDIHRRVQHLQLIERQAEILEMISADVELPQVLTAIADALVDAADGIVAAAVVAPNDGGRAGVSTVAGGPRPPDDDATWQVLTGGLPDGDPNRGRGMVPVSPPWTEHVTQVAHEGIRPLGVRALVGEGGGVDALLAVYGTAADPATVIAIPDLLVNTAALALAHHRRRVELERRALRDPLTGLPNRWQLRFHLQQLLASPHRDASATSVLFIDLDDLKRVNDSLGHEIGDVVLKQIAERLRRSVRETDLLCRFGGDEFVVVTEHTSNGNDAIWLADRMLNAMRKPMEINGMISVVTASIGIAHVGPAYAEADDVLRDADAAMYRAKDAGRDQYAIFDDVMRTKAMRRFDVEAGLRRALDDGLIAAYFQPQFRPDDSSVVGLEALARWEHPEKGTLAPTEWIEIAEQSGLIGPIGEQILAQAGALAAQLDELPLDKPPIRMSVNVAASQLGRPGLVAHVVETLEDADVTADRLCLELTESSLADLSDPLGALAELKGLGLRLSVDDWGTGYSSLEYLRELPVDELKVDRHFIRALDESGGVKLVRGICQLARALGLDLVAEGVETAAQLGHVRAFRFDLVQGFLLAHPMPATDVLELIHPGAEGGERTGPNDDDGGDPVRSPGGLTGS